MQEIKILYEDNHLLVVHKPKGILSQEDSSHRPDILTLMKEDLKQRYNKPGNVYLGLVHRLDVAVEGVIVLAKTSKAASRLSEEIREHRFEKRYLAVCSGLVSPVSGTLKDDLTKDHGKNLVYTKQNRPKELKNHGKERPAVLNYRVLEQIARLSLVEINLLSGRSHQIRVQFASRGWPLVGDRRYDNKLSSSSEEESIALLAYSLSFKHPTKDEIINVHTEIPDNDPWKAFKIRKKDK